MNQQEVIASLCSGYDVEISCYEKLLESLLKAKEELCLDKLENVIVLQQTQKKIMEKIDETEKRLTPYKGEWERFKRTAANTEEGQSLLSKIKGIEGLLKQILVLEDEAIVDLNVRKNKKTLQIKNQRDRKNGHLAYRSNGPVEAVFWDRKS